MKKIIIVILISSLCMCMKCKDSMLPEGIETKVSGNIYDSTNEIPVIDQKLIIQELNEEPGFHIGPNINYSEEIDSTYTDENGDYELIFETTGKGDKYRILFEHDNEFWTYYTLPVAIENIGSSQEVNFDFLHLYPVNLKITLESDVNYLPIRISPNFTSFRSSDWLEQTETEYVRQIFTDKNSEEEIRFLRTKPDGDYQIASFIIPKTNTTNPIEFEILIKNSDFSDSN